MCDGPLYTSAILSKKGDVYVFGNWGEKTYTEPHLVEGLTGVVDVSMAFGHILALTDNNEIPTLAQVFYYLRMNHDNVTT